MNRTLTKMVTGGAAVAASLFTFGGLAHADSANPPVPASGNQGTEITFTPPSGASCSGTASSGFHWDTYIVSSSVNSAALTFDLNGPVPPSGQVAFPLFSTTGSQLSQKNPATTPAGLITGLSTINFQVYVDAGVLPAGSYKIGYACTNSVGAVEGGHFWEQPITISNVTANGLTYSLVTPPAQVPEAPLSVLLPLTGAALVGAGVIAKRRRSAGAAI